MSRERIVFLSASVRFVLASVAVLLLPLVAPELTSYRLVFAVYVAIAGVFQLLIWRDLGGDTRTIASGVVDAAIVTFFVHLVGSVGTMTVALYAFASMINTVIAGRRVGFIIASVCSASYVGLLIAEGTGLLSFAPAGPSWIHGTPSPTELVSSGALALAMILSGTASVGALVAHDEKRSIVLADANRKLEELSQRDPLTGLYNRRHLMNRLSEELLFRRRGRSLAVLMIDLDHFKRVNDAEGHARGDELLIKISVAIGRSLRETDLVGRYGGDEFVVLLPETAALEAETAAQRVVVGVRAAGLEFDPRRPVTASVGVAIARETDESSVLLQRADRAAYVAKGRRGDGVAMESDADSEAPRATA